VWCVCVVFVCLPCLCGVCVWFVCGECDSRKFFVFVVFVCSVSVFAFLYVSLWVYCA